MVMAEASTLENQAWAGALAAACRLGDGKRQRRLTGLLAAFGARPQASIPDACGNWADTKAAYRFLGNPHVTVQALTEGFGVAAAQAGAGRPLMLAVSDTTTINLSGLNVEGLGPVNDSAAAKGVHLHTVLAVDPQGFCLGVLDQQFWVRPPRGTATPAATRPFEEKESAKWVHAIDAARARLHETLGPAAPEILHVMDREGDVWETLQTIDDWGERAVIRATQDRRTSDPERTAYAAVRAQSPLAVTALELPAAPGRAARTATVEVRVLNAELQPDPRKHPAGWPMAWTLLEILEPEPPSGTAALHWRLWTREPAGTLAEALLVLCWYMLRWRIEDFHFTLKSGCQVERLKLETLPGLLKALALRSATAARVLALRDRARQQPEAPAAVLLTLAEMQVLWAAQHRRPMPAGTPLPTLREAALWVGRLGGHLNRKGDGMPGVRTLWRGLAALSRLVEGHRLARMTIP